MRNLIPGADSLFKYLLSIGIAMFLFALVYPLKKEQQLRLDAIDISRKQKVLSEEIIFLKQKGVDLSLLKDNAQKQIDSLSEFQKKHPSDYLQLHKLKIEIADKFEQRKSKYLEIGYNLKIKNDNLAFEQLKHIEIKEQIWEYAIFKAVLLVLGIIFSIAGFVFWIGAAYLDDIIKGGMLSNSTHATTYVRCMDYLVGRPIRWIMAAIIAALVIMFLFYQFVVEAIN